MKKRLKTCAGVDNFLRNAQYHIIETCPNAKNPAFPTEIYVEEWAARQAVQILGACRTLTVATWRGK